MKKEVTAKAATIEEAVAKAVSELGVSRDECEIEVLETARKFLFGKMKEAVVKVSCEVEDAPVVVPAAEESKAAPRSEKTERKLLAAKEYLAGIFEAMGLNAVEIKAVENEDGAMLTLEGEGLAVLIGHHGETLDALQYLVALTCNRLGGDYYRIILDCGNYREKRQEALRGLATRIAAKVKKTGRNQSLEPMNPYERRIIHSVVSEIEGVTSKSCGEEPNRRVVIMSDNPARQNDRGFGRNDSRGGHRGGRRRDDGYNRPEKRELTMEEILKSDFKQKEESAELYSKIEL